MEVQVFATGLNFKDVMLAMGMLSADAVEGGFCAHRLGIECSGIVVSKGTKTFSGYKAGILDFTHFSL